MVDLEEYEKLKNIILSPGSEKTIKTLMVTNAAGKEGSTSIASNLAVTLAKDNAFRTLLVDGNLRYPAVHKYFDLDDTAGLSDLILGKASIDNVLKRPTASPDLSIVTSGNRIDNPAAIFGIQKLRDVLNDLKTRFDYLIFDSPPVNNYPDAQILAPQMDGVILVVHSGKTRFEVALNAKEQLEKVRSNIIGVVLNRRKYVIPGFIYQTLR